MIDQKCRVIGMSKCSMHSEKNIEMTNKHNCQCKSRLMLLCSKKEKKEGENEPQNEHPTRLESHIEYPERSH